MQVYLVRPDGTGLRRVTDGGAETNQLSGWSRDGRYLLLGSNRANPRAMDGYLYDVAAGGPMRLVLRNEGVGGLNALSLDGKRALVSRVKSRGDSNLFLLDVESGATTLLTPHEGPGNVNGTLTADGDTVYLRSDLGRDLAAFARIRIGADGTPGRVEGIATRDGAELDTFAVTEDGTVAALVWNEAGRSALSIVDLGDPRVVSPPEGDSPAETPKTDTNQAPGFGIGGRTAPADRRERAKRRVASSPSRQSSRQSR